MTQVALTPARKRVATRRIPASVAPAMAVEPKREPPKPLVIPDTEQSFVLERDVPISFLGNVFELKRACVTGGFLTVNGREFAMIHITVEPRIGKKTPQMWLMKIPNFVTFRLSEVAGAKMQFDVVHVNNVRNDAPLTPDRAKATSDSVAAPVS